MQSEDLIKQNTDEHPVKKPGVLPIYSVTPFTMLDFPGRTACIVWFTGCNMRCPYCHNPQIVKGKGRGNIHEVMAFLKKRRGLLDGVVLSGGEASAYPGLPDFIKDLKDMGYAIKLDTNGLRPDIIRSHIDSGLIDYIALDYKAPPDKFKRVTGTDKYELFSQTLDILCTQKTVEFETRTTVHTDLISEHDVSLIIRDLEMRGFTGTHAIQNFTHSDDRPTLGFMKQQTRIIDITQIYKSQSMNVIFRNF
ncbi:anaerobic ribonucleoside-triphosphate reductase activating protein [Micavibrio aeruginosavorus]|uniref:Ribonucleotide reductase of class III (Anaerobic), activating protein n=1 Tax=Micavibrio aeruginosavorus EPB TaxID=349215 RepID=M4VGR2_9BACT|nr:anaerobic ribonucleoside-triphosphate reductase activating protein [Micavibrio aeruginosavorus]AGH97670.1 Ribonucleotide reductase of class III (anaerobic), activating protein [Micavibrio aeruginosavorus EPB]